MEVVCLIWDPTLTSRPCLHTFYFDVPTSSIFIENVFIIYTYKYCKVNSWLIYLAPFLCSDSISFLH